MANLVFGTLSLWMLREEGTMYNHILWRCKFYESNVVSISSIMETVFANISLEMLSFDRLRVKIGKNIHYHL